MIAVRMCPGRLPLNGALSSAFSPVRWLPCRSGVLTLILSKSTCELYYMNGSGAWADSLAAKFKAGDGLEGFGPLASTTGGGRGCGSNAAVAAAATAAAAEAAAASKAAAAREAPPKPLPRRTSGAPSTYACPRISPTCQKSPAAARDSWTARTFPGGGVWSGGPGPRPRGDGAWVVAAPRHGLRRGHRNGLRPLHLRVHGLRSGLLVALRECHGAEVRVSR